VTIIKVGKERQQDVPEIIPTVGKTTSVILFHLAFTAFHNSNTLSTLAPSSKERIKPKKIV